MILAALGALVLGVVVGALFIPDQVAQQITNMSDLVLCGLMLSVGVSVGANKQMLQKLRTYNMKILVIPAGVVLGSILAGAALAPLTGNSLREGMAVTSGAGWYSLSGIMVTEMLGARIGSMAFISNLLREVLAFCTIPFFIKKLGAYSAIAVAGATSEDTTLPIFIRYGGEDIALIAVVNGMLVSAAVPLLLNFIAK